MADSDQSVVAEYTEEFEKSVVEVTESGEHIHVFADDVELLANGWVKCRDTDADSKRYTGDHLLIPPRKVELIGVSDTGHKPDLDFAD